MYLINMGKYGQAIGSALGGLAGGAVEKLPWKTMGQVGGSFLGGLLPFKKGGRIKKTGPILAHRGETILPKGVRPTRSQVRRIKRGGGRM